MIQQSAVQDIGTLIDKLSAKLSVPANHLWSVMVRQQYINGITEWAWVVVWLILAALLAVGFRRLHKKMVAYRIDEIARLKAAGYSDASDDEASTRTVVLILGWVGPILAAAGAIQLAITAIQLRLNPEYFAIQAILDAIKPK